MAAVGREQQCSHLDSERETDDVATCIVSVVNGNHFYSERETHLDSERETDDVATCIASVVNGSHFYSERDIKKLCRELLLITQ